jgi:tryptophan synthase alpha chain
MTVGAGPNGQEPEARSAGPEGQARSAGPEGQARSAGPEDQARSAGPEGQSRSAGPEDQARSAGPEGQSRSGTEGAQRPLAARFAAARAAGRAALVGYLTGFDPTRRASLDRLLAACEAGLDVLELGIPFSDPTADGPTIQAAMVRALASGASVAGVIDLAAEVRRRVDVPVVLFGYANPLLRFGPTLAATAAAAGVAGLLVVDLPPEHAGGLLTSARAHGLDWIGLVAPTSTPQRQAAVLANTTGFVYAVSLTGVTGTALDAGDAQLQRALAGLRAATSVPVAVGFGVRTPDDVRALAPHADGVVVGSALIEASQRGPQELAELVARLRAATSR